MAGMGGMVAVTRPMVVGGMVVGMVVGLVVGMVEGMLVGTVMAVMAVFPALPTNRPLANITLCLVHGANTGIKTKAPWAGLVRVGLGLHCTGRGVQSMWRPSGGSRRLTQTVSSQRSASTARQHPRT